MRMGATQRPLTTNDDGDFDPAFTPDGKQIVFESDRDGDVEIWIMNANGGHQRDLTAKRSKMPTLGSPRTGAGSSMRSITERTSTSSG